MKRKEMVNVSSDAKKNRSANWNPFDTDLLCDLVREIGLKSVLNCRTNGTTNEIKRADWVTISERYNSHPSVATQRNVDAIIFRYKKIMQVLRNHFAMEKYNAKQTGGGSSSVPKIEITGPMLELRSYYGHLLSGLPSYDSDFQTPQNAMETSKTPPKECSTEEMEILTENYCSTEETNKEITITQTSSPPAEDKGTKETNVTPNSSSNGQHPKPKATVEGKRIDLIDEERKRMTAFGARRKKFYEDEHAARLEEIKERKAFNLALHKKQMEFWNTAIQTMKSNEPFSPVGTVFSIPNPSVERLASYMQFAASNANDSGCSNVPITTEQQFTIVVEALGNQPTLIEPTEDTDEDNCNDTFSK